MISDSSGCYQVGNIIESNNKSMHYRGWKRAACLRDAGHIDKFASFAVSAENVPA